MKEIIITPEQIKASIRTSICNDLVRQSENLIEEKIKELIKPYIDTKINEADKLIKELEYKQYKLISIEHKNYRKYILTHIPTGKSDYFTIERKINVNQDSNQISYKYTATQSISDIVRNIK